MYHFSKSMRNIVRAVIFTALFILIFILLSRAFAVGTSTPDDGMENRISRAYRGEDKNSLDVIFVGNSDIYRAVSPVDLYYDTGISSAVCGKPGGSLSKVSRSVKDILKYQNPKVLVLETDCMFSGRNPHFKNKSSGHNSGDTGKASASKIAGMFFSKLKKHVSSLDSAIIAAVNFEFPLIKYHNRWDKLRLSSLADHSGKYYKFDNKGMAYSDKVKPYDPQNDYMDSSSGKRATLTSANRKAFDKIYNLCKDNGIRLVLVTVPSANTWNNSKSRAVQELAEEYGLTYYDYNLNYPKGFDWSVHSKDGGNHLNYDGALTVTKDFGERLQNDLDLTATDLTKSQKQQWEKDYRQFHDKISAP